MNNTPDEIENVWNDSGSRRQRVRAVTLAAAAPVPLPPPVSAPPTARTAPPPRNALAAAGPSSAEEIPGLPPQPAAYFRRLPPRP